MDNVQIEDTTIANPDSLQTPLPMEKKKPVGLIVAMVICIIVAIGGIAFGVFSFIDSNQKSQQISSLKNDISAKDDQINTLEVELLELTFKADELGLKPETSQSGSDAPAPETETTSTDNVASITLGDILDDNDEQTVFKIGECTYDGGASATSVKCPAIINGKNGLISSNSSDSFLRLIIPKN